MSAFNCPECNYPLEKHHNLNSSRNKPGPGDVSCCLNCGHAFKFNSDGNQVSMTAADMNQVKQYYTLAVTITEIKRRGFLPHYKK